MMTLQERFAVLFPKPHPHGLKAEIARICRVSAPTVSNWLNNPEKVATISRTHAEAIIDHFGLKASARWLAEGIGSRNDEKKSEDENSPEGSDRYAITSQIDKRRAKRAVEWPFPHINEAKLRALRGEHAQSMEDAILAAAARLKIDVLYDRGNKTGT